MRPLARRAVCAIAAFLGAAGSAGAATVLRVPDDATGAPGTSVSVPIEAIPADGILALDLRLEYDPDVLTATSVARTSISEALSLNFNLTPAGRVLISLFGTASMAGSGPVALVTFDVVGSAGSQTVLDLTSGQANEGQIPSTLDDGLFTACDGPAPTGEILGVRVDGTNPSTVTWQAAPSPARYDVATGGLVQLRADGGVESATCLEDDVATPSTTDPRPAPEPGAGLYYVVRAQNGCGAGPYGNDSSGAPRDPTSACP